MGEIFKRIDQFDLDFFCSIVGSNGCLSSAEQLRKYGHDETEDLVFEPELVVLPKDTDQIAKLLQYCEKHKIAATVRGGGTGLAGGALPIEGGLLISMEFFNQIVELDKENFQVTVQPGVITEVLQNELKEQGLYYPPDPSSKGISFIGGNVSTNAGGPRAVKYGVVKDYVLNLQVVTPSGLVFWTGANTLKNSTGYNVTQLMVGSEGTLGVITAIVLKLIPYPTHSMLMLIPFKSAEDACRCVGQIFKAGIIPSALEFMERTAIEWAIEYLGESTLPLGQEVEAHLLVEVDGFYPDILMDECERIAIVATEGGSGEILFADDEAQKSNLWKLRRNVAHAVKNNSIYKEEDTVVPRASLPKLLKGIKEIGTNYGFQSVCYGHAGDGNLHVNILKGDLSESIWKNEIPKGIREIFSLVKSLGGTISGEHGIGLVQKPYMDILFDQDHLDLFRKIKLVFDPKGILNPGKIVP